MDAAQVIDLGRESLWIAVMVDFFQRIFERIPTLFI